MSILSFYNGKRVLVTGHTGFKGSWMCQMLLMAGAEVTGYALKAPTTPNLYELCGLEQRIKSVFGDVRDYEHLKKIFDEVQPEIVIHMAAQPIVLDAYENPRYTYDVNVMGTVNVCECIRKTDSVKSFVNVTTDKVYQNNEWEFPYREIDYLDGFDPYSNSKSCSELVTASYVRSFFKKREVAISTCRAGNVIGGGDFSPFRILPDCYRDTVSGKGIAVRNPYSVRPYQHVLEAVFFYLLVARQQWEEISLAGSYNVGPEYSDCLKTSEVCTLFCDFWGENASWKITGSNGPHEANILRLDTSKAKTKLGWKPAWDVKRAIEETVRWYKSFVANEDMRRVTDEQIRSYLEEINKK